MCEMLFRGKLTERFADAAEIRPDLARKEIIKDGFVYGSLVVSGDKYFICTYAYAYNRYYAGNADGTMFEVDPETVGQFTGLTDKNGVRIFEGDILKFLDFQKGVVTQECGAFGIGVMPYIDWDYLESEIHTVTGCDNHPYFCRNDNFVSLWEMMWNYNQEERCCDVVEIIGNIYDNPELMKGGGEN